MPSTPSVPDPCRCTECLDAVGDSGWSPHGRRAVYVERVRRAIHTSCDYREAYVIGDIHGDPRALLRCLWATGTIRSRSNNAGSSPWRALDGCLGPSDRGPVDGVLGHISWHRRTKDGVSRVVFLLGDLVDDTRDGAVVPCLAGGYEKSIVATVLRLQREARTVGDALVWVLGNHDIANTQHRSLVPCRKYTSDVRTNCSRTNPDQHSSARIGWMRSSLVDSGAVAIATYDHPGLCGLRHRVVMCHGGLSSRFVDRAVDRHALDPAYAGRHQAVAVPTPGPHTDELLLYINDRYDELVRSGGAPEQGLLSVCEGLHGTCDVSWCRPGVPGNVVRTDGSPWCPCKALPALGAQTVVCGHSPVDRPSVYGPCTQTHVPGDPCHTHATDTAQMEYIQWHGHGFDASVCTPVTGSCFLVDVGMSRAFRGRAPQYGGALGIRVCRNGHVDSLVAAFIKCPV